MAERIKILETTVARLGDERVGLGNIWEREYDLPDGTTRSGPTGMLKVIADGRTEIVGEGSVVELGGATWEVVSVREGDERAGGDIELVRRDA